MNWNDSFPADKTPTFDDMERKTGVLAPLWRDLREYLETTYGIQPAMSYSRCASQPGWNVKYRKSGKSLCTLYPMEGFFIALVVVGAKEESEVELALDTLSPYTAGLYRRVPFSCGGRWLMIHVTDEAVLNDVKRLIRIRVKPRT